MPQHTSTILTSDPLEAKSLSRKWLEDWIRDHANHGIEVEFYVDRVVLIDRDPKALIRTGKFLT